MHTQLSKARSTNHFLEDSQIKRGFSFVSGLQPVTYMIIFLSLVLEIKSQCCVTFDNSQCIQCPLGTHLFRGSCLFDRPNCKQYAHGFDCIACVEGFVMDVNGDCIATSQVMPPIPSSGFQDLPIEEYDTVTIRNIVQAVEQSFGSLGPMTLFKIYYINTTANYLYTNPTTIGLQLNPNNIIYNKFYKLIFIIDTGLFEVVVLFEPNINKPAEVLTDQSLSLANYKLFQKYPYQIFIDLLTDPYGNEIHTQMESLYTYYLNDTIVDAFKSIDATTQTNAVYRIFVTNPNQGLVQLKINIRLTPADGQAQNASAATELYNIIKQIVNSKNLSQYFVNSEVGNVQKIEKNSIIMFTVVFAFPNLTFPNGTKVEANFTFQIDNNTNRVIVRQLHLQNLIQYNKGSGSLSWGQFCLNNRTASESNSGDKVQPLTASKFFNIPHRNFTAPTTTTPTNKPIDLQLIFQEQINLSNFFKTAVYDSSRRYLLKYYPADVVGGDIVKLAYAANRTQQFYEMHYLGYSDAQPMANFMFTLHLDTQVIELISFFRTTKNTRHFVSVDILNRESVLANLPILQRTLIDKFIPQSVFYDPGSELSNIQIYNYTNSVNGIETNESRIQLKYYYPSQLGLQFEYVQFRYVVDDNIHEINTVVYPIQSFVPLNASEAMLAETLGFYAQINLQIDNQTTDLTVLNITKSLDRKDRQNIYRLIVKYQYYNQTLLWQIDSIGAYKKIIANLTAKPALNQSNSAIVLTNSSINSSEILAQSSNNSSINTQNSTTYIGSVYNNNNISQNVSIVLPTLELFNLTDMVYKFPTITPNTTKVSTEVSAYSINVLLSMMEIKITIAKFFNLTLDSIKNVKVVNIQTILNIIDTYTIRFQINRIVPGNLKGTNTTKLTDIKQFTFRVGRKCNGFPQVSADSWALSTWLKMNPNANSANSTNKTEPSNSLKIGEAVPTNVSNKNIQIMANNKPLTLLSQIFNRSFTIKQPEPPRSFTINISNLSSFTQRINPNFIKFPMITATVNATKLKEAMDLFIQNVGEVKPVKYVDNITFNPADLELVPMPDCVDAQLVVLVSSLVNNTNVYHPQLCNITNISMAKTDKTIYMVLLTHIYYGTIKLWLALPSYLPSPFNRLLTVEYLNDYVYASSEKSIIKQMEQLSTVESIVSYNLSSILRNFNYHRIVSLDDLLYWEYNKINCVQQLRLYYELQGFIVKVAVIISTNDTKNKTTLDIYLNEKSIVRNDKDIRISRVGASECVHIDSETSFCLRCNKGYYVDQKDGKCYKSIENCSIQSRQLCIACQNGFVATDYKCT